MERPRNVASFSQLLSTTQSNSKTQAFAVFHAPYLNPRLTRYPWRSRPFSRPITPPDFMQSDLTELPKESTNPTNPSDLGNTSQYGLHSDQLPSPELHISPLEGDAVPAGSSPGHSPSASILRDQWSRLSLDESADARPKPSFQRISEYEKALSPSPPRKPNQGPGFTVVKKSGNSLNGPQLENFPNEVLTHILSHLPASALSAVSLVSRRFHSLVTTPHAWRIAFSRFFPGQVDAEDSVTALTNRRGSDQEAHNELRSEQRFFTRLTALASWRSEYILRTRLLRSLEKGKPSQIAPGRGASSRANSAANNANAVVTYNSQMFATINHIHAVFGTGKKSPRFMHGTDETGTACTSDPNIGKVDNWGLTDPQALPQFSDIFAGDQPYGNGNGPAGLPNCMDLSQPFGMVYGEGFPGGQAYFRPTEEMRGRFLNQPVNLAGHQFGIPKIPDLTEAISAVWIAKTKSVPSMTDGLIGIMTGSTLGVITAYSLGADTANGHRIGKGQLTAKWVLSPGVPIICLKVDDSYSSQRKSSGRIWAVSLNALGEVFYLTTTPSSAVTESRVDEATASRHAWTAGRTAYWCLVEPSRRVARDDPYHEFEIPGSYSPRSSSSKMKLSPAQISAETLEVEKFLAYRPSHFRKICEGWDMRRKLEVDFAGDDGNRAGEAICVIKCGNHQGDQAEIRRFTRWKSELAPLDDYPVPRTPPIASTTRTMASLFGGSRVIAPWRTSTPESASVASTIRGTSVINRARTSYLDRSPTLPPSPISTEIFSSTVAEEWRSTNLSLKGFPDVEITASAIDMSTPALLTVDEDPLLTMNGASNVSTPLATPSDQGTSTAATIPGHRGRFLAIGMKTGIVVMWNMRGPQSTNPAMVNELQPMRTIYTDSPEISCLAVSALYVVHGGNDGLVQTWDPLGSTLQPIRTLNSRFSSRARRRLIQAAASIQGVGINLYAAGAIAIDPDPTVLRGMVSLGTHLRYWSYSSSSADQYQSKKRRLRRSAERGSNGSSDKFTSTGRGALMDYIATEQEELKNEKMRRERQDARLRARFGVGLGGLSEEEALRYAEMISAETFQKDEERRTVDTGYAADSGDPSSTQSVWSSSATATPEGSVQGRMRSPTQSTDDQFDQDLEEAIRLSLLDGLDSGGRSPKASGSGEYDIPITYKQKKKGRRSASSSPSSSQVPKHRTMLASSAGQSHGVAADDLDFALRLSLAEEKNRMGETIEVDASPWEEFPKLKSPEGDKGKGKAR